MLKTLKMVFTGSLHGAQQERDRVKKSRQVCLLCPWERHLTGFLHLHLPHEDGGTPSIYHRQMVKVAVDSMTSRSLLLWYFWTI